MPDSNLAQKAISPGSTEFGDRQGLEQGLGDVLNAGPSPAPSGGPLPAAPDGAQAGLDPINALLGGLHTSDLPVTSGLRQGPGRAPLAPGASQLPATTMQKLQQVALNAKSPQMRHMARVSLRRIARNGRSG